MSPKREVVKKTILNHIEKTTIHAIRNVIQEDNHLFMKIFWLILFLLGLAGCVYCN